MSAKTWSWIALLAVALGVVAWAAWPSGDDATQRERVLEIAHDLRCPDCEALSVDQSSTPTARAIKADIARRVADGQSDDAIRQSYVDRYGESILLNPEGSGLGFLLWGLPVVAVLLGAGGLAFAFRRWRSEPRLHATDADEQLVARTREETT